MALAQKGVDVRQTGTHVMFRALLQDSSGALVTSGTTSLYLYEIQSDGTLKSYDWADNTFKATALTTETQALTHRTGNNGGTNTGVWTYALSTVSGFTAGGVYLARVKNTGASPTDQVREFQYGGAEGDLVATANGTGAATIDSNAVKVGPSGSGTAQTARDLGAQLDAAVSSRLAASGYTAPPTAIQNRQEMDSNSAGLAAIYNRLGAPAGASIAADVAGVITHGDANWGASGGLTAGEVWAYATRELSAGDVYALAAQILALLTSSTGRIVAGSTLPADGGTATVYAGADYVAALGNAFYRTVSGLPDLSGSTATLLIYPGNKRFDEKTGAAIAPAYTIDADITGSAGTYTFSADVNKEVTSVLARYPSTRHGYEFWTDDGSGLTVPRCVGDMKVL